MSKQLKRYGRVIIIWTANYWNASRALITRSWNCEREKRKLFWMSTARGQVDLTESSVENWWAIWRFGGDFAALIGFWWSFYWEFSRLTEKIWEKRDFDWVSITNFLDFTWLFFWLLLKICLILDFINLNLTFQCRSKLLDSIKKNDWSS